MKKLIYSLEVDEDVKLNSIFVLNSTEIKTYNIYKTFYNTIILEYLHDSNHFIEIEIGLNRFGYFIEVDDKITTINENLEFTSDNIEKLNTDIKKYIHRYE